MTDKNKTVYIVTSGEYSDYHIDAVFLDRSLAEAYCDKYPDTEIGEYTADEEASETDKLWYDVSIHADGDLAVRCSSLKFNRVVRDRAYVFTVQAEGMSKAKAIALERYHAMVPIQRSHFPWLLARCIPVRHWGRIEFVMPNYDYFTYEIVIDETVDIFELFEYIANATVVHFKVSLSNKVMTKKKNTEERYYAPSLECFSCKKDAFGCSTCPIYKKSLKQ